MSAQDTTAPAHRLLSTGRGVTQGVVSQDYRSLDTMLHRHGRWKENRRPSRRRGGAMHASFPSARATSAPYKQRRIAGVRRNKALVLPAPRDTLLLEPACSVPLCRCSSLFTRVGR
eukprot:6768771-Pyramimonas_sp.AAC.1